MGLFTDHSLEQKEFKVDTERSKEVKELEDSFKGVYIANVKHMVNKELEESLYVIEPVLRETPAGFIWEDTEITRVGRVKNRKGKYLSVETDSQIMMIYISKSGKIRVDYLTDKGAK
jgi:hypothetical protein